LAGLIAGLAALGLWELLSRAGTLNPLYFPPPTVVGITLVARATGGDLAPHAAATLARLSLAFGAAALVGVPLGLAMGMIRPLRLVLDPYIAALYPLPKIALLPLLMILLGVGEQAFVLAGSLTALFQIILNTYGGVTQIDPVLLEVGHNYGARGLALFRRILLPAALPSILTGLRLGFGLALITTIAVEFTAAKSGLGHLVFRAWQTLAAAEMFAALAVVGVIGLAITRGLLCLQRRLLAWQQTYEWD